jgi:thermitase
MRRIRLVVAVVLLVSACASTSWAQAARANRFVAGQVLVKFKPGAAASVKAEAHRRGGGTLLTEVPRTGVQLVAVPAGTEASAIARYRNNPNVLYSEPNYIRSIPAPAGVAAAPVVPGDHNFKEQWGLHNTGQQFLCLPWVFGDLCFYIGTPDADIDAPEAWATSTGTPNVTVAVIDSGVDYTNPDLAANYAGGQDFINGDPDPMDDLGHGTHVAGIIAAAMNNPTGDPAAAEGVVGVAPNARILAYKVCAGDGTCSDIAIEQAIAQAIADHANVINMSFGGPDYSQSMDESLQAAWAAGLVLVAAAGNDGTNAFTYPAALPHVISVGAFDEDDNRASFSNFGNWVDIAAPGNVIMSTYPMVQCAASTVPGDTGCYTWLSGTSMASPFVAGAAALVWSRGDVTSNQQVVDILLNSADPAGVAPARLDSWTIHGGLNVANALAYAVTNLPPAANAGPDQHVIDADFDGVELVTLDGGGSTDPDGTIVSYEWQEGSTVIATGATATAWLAAGTHTLTLTVTDDAGSSGTDNVTITVTTPNRPPIVSDTGATAVVGTPVAIALGGTDFETCELTFSVVQAPGSGTLGAMQDLPCLAGSPNGDTASIAYTPASAGTYTFTYKANDGSTDSNVGTVTVTVVNRPPTASDTSWSTVVGTPVTITLGAMDVETCELTFSIVQGPGIGGLSDIHNQPCVAGSPNSDTARVIYAPGGAAGTFTFTYRADDGTTESNIATVTVTVTNHPPTASDASASTAVGAPVTITLAAADAETCDLTFSVVQTPGSGTLGAILGQPCAAGSPNVDTAQITYTPASAGTYAFTYKANDGIADSNTATVTVTVTNRSPIASDTSVSTVLGTPVTIALGATDAESCELTFAVVQGPASGTLGAMQDQPCVAGSPNRDTARITYTPGSGAGSYTFTYKTNDGSADSNVATVTVTVTAPPPAPLAVTGISPNVVSQNVGTRSFVITGTGFAAGARVAFVNGTGGQTPRVLTVTRDSSTQLTATVEIRSGGPKKNRLWDVMVTNPDGSSAVGARLLTVTP